MSEFLYIVVPKSETVREALEAHLIERASIDFRQNQSGKLKVQECGFVSAGESYLELKVGDGDLWCRRKIKKERDFVFKMIFLCEDFLSSESVTHRFEEHIWRKSSCEVRTVNIGELEQNRRFKLG
jgi:hypothetical protein